MNNVKKHFSIRDLENLSGIKAHTIRIWEKRYHLLSPERTATNIRTYSISSLQKLLNITMLYHHGYKISKIARIKEQDIPLIVKDIIAKNNVQDHAINAFKLAMINFDQTMFIRTYNGLHIERSFPEIFTEVFIPLLNELGLLWQTNTISPAHEHFITGLIKQKIQTNTDLIQHLEPTKTDKIFVPFLPENEIHEIGLLYLNYAIVRQGYKSIYLGQTIPLENLKDVMKYYDNLYFLSYFTVVPTKEHINKYILEFNEMAEKNNDTSKLWILGRQTQFLVPKALPARIKTFTSIESVVAAVLPQSKDE